MIANIIPEKRTNPEKEIYSYLVPEKFKGQIKVGSTVEIPFGKEVIRGVVLDLETKIISKASRHFKLKEIKSLDPHFFIPENYLNIALWIKDYYLCSFGEAISIFMPPKMKRPQSISENFGEKDCQDNVKLTQDQEKIFLGIKKLLSEKSKKPALIVGVTGSGKTEIYLKIINEVLKQNEQVIFLVPEIMLTPQMIERLESYFPGEVALMHSGLAQSEKYSAYKSFFSNGKKIIIGPRSALLVPSDNLGVIIIDEEQEESYKQEKNPKYDALTLAEQIAKKTNSLLVLGSATPRVESYFKAKNKEYELFILDHRYNNLILPTGSIVDLRNEIKASNNSPISIKLQDKISKILSKKRKILLYLNRLGMATFVSCRECGYVFKCKNCDIPMVYHLKGLSNSLFCHHCNFVQTSSTTCPKCGGLKIKYFGAGTEKIERELARIWPKAKIIRAESKSFSKKDGYSNVYASMKRGDYDILLGTQIVAKGLDLKEIDLVGVISADTGLHLPYYKSQEKIFNLITQVSGRSGRGREDAGETIIQSYWPDSPAIRFAALHDYQGFYNEEIKSRKEFLYPPFVHLVRVISEDRTKEKSLNELTKLAKELDRLKINYIGPGQCFLHKIRNRYRHHLIIKIKNLPDKNLYKAFLLSPYLFWDVDPTNLL